MISFSYEGVTLKKIPKIIHYCWFGHNELPDKSKNYIKGWAKECPNYKIIKWSENNFKVNKYSFTRKAYHAHNWAAVSDYVRLVILYKYGGIYLDTDVEIIKSLDSLLKNDSFLGQEDYGVINSGLIYGARPHDINIKQILNIYNKIGNKKDYYKYLLDEVHITTTYFHKIGFKYNNKFQKINGCSIYPMDYFCPKQYESNSIDITKNTYSIHHYFDSWSGIGLHGKKKIDFLLRKFLRDTLGTRLFLFLYRKHMYRKKGNI